MIVIADTSPLRYLILIGQQLLLHQLFGKVITPQAVYEELTHSSTPSLVSTWIRSHPEWIEIQRPSFLLPLIILDQGEREAISLAKELNADILLIDERRGREAAKAQSLNITGTLGIIEQACLAGLLTLNEALTSLLQTNFYIREEDLKRLEKRVRDHQQQTRNSNSE